MKVAESERTLFRLIVAAFVFTYCLMLLGAAVRTHGAGLACPDWPLCHGRLIPPLQGPVLLEYGHRLAASGLGLLLLALNLAAWRQRRRHPLLPALSALALALYLVQAVLGGLTVLLRLPPGVGTAHLGMAMALLALLMIMATLFGRQAAAPPPGGAVGRRALVAAVAVYLLVLVGAYMRSTGASLACPDWPLCQGQVLPSLSWPVVVHLAHRLGALAAGALVLATVSAARRAPGGNGLNLATAALGLFLLQVALGGLTVFLRLTPLAGMAHMGVAAAILAILVHLAAGGWHLEAVARPAPEGVSG